MRHCYWSSQFVLGYSAIATGVRLLPLAGAVFVGAAVTSLAGRRFGPRPTILAGMTIAASGVLLLTGIDGASTYDDFLAPLILLGLGIGLSLSPCTDTIMGLFPEADLGVAGGLNDTALELGGALGVAILGLVLATSYRTSLDGTIAVRLPAAALASARGSVGNALAVAQQVAHSRLGGATQAQALRQAIDSSFAHAVSHTSLIAAVVMLAGAVVVLAVLPGSRAQARAQAGGARATLSPAPGIRVRRGLLASRSWRSSEVSTSAGRRSRP